MSSCIAIGLVAGVSGMVWVGPSIAQMMGKDLPTLRWLSSISKAGVPLRAFLLQYVIVMILLLTASFKFVLICSQFPLICCEMLGVLGVIVLRFKAKKNKIPGGEKKPTLFRSPLYPLPQLIFLGISLMALVYAMMTNPREGIIGIAILGGSLALYPLLHRKTAIMNKE